jgi:hypothetical protein
MHVHHSQAHVYMHVLDRSGGHNIRRIASQERHSTGEALPQGGELLFHVLEVPWNGRQPAEPCSKARMQLEQVLHRVTCLGTSSGPITTEHGPCHPLPASSNVWMRTALVGLYRRTAHHSANVARLEGNLPLTCQGTAGTNVAGGPTAGRYMQICLDSVPE